jgi:hypothetical protein
VAVTFGFACRDRLFIDSPTALRITPGSSSGCDAAIMEFFVAEVRSLKSADFRTCRLWKMWSFFACCAAAAE